MVPIILKALFVVFGSWALLHILAVFGVFLALAYPIWNLLIPKKVPCLICNMKSEGEYCQFCQKEIRKADIHPKNIKSLALNSMLILFFTLTSVGLIYIESGILHKMGIPPTPKTVSFVIPKRHQHRIGEIFPMKIELVGIKTPINAIQTDISFDPEILEVTDISTSESFANIFIQKEIDNQSGYTRLTGGLPNPGYFSDKGVFGTVLFKGKGPGVTQVEFLPSSMVLANDGRGTNVIKELASASYLILPEVISEEERKEQEVLLGAAVLGEKTDNTKMIFYDEGSILGTELERDIAEGKNVSTEKGEGILTTLFTLVDKFNEVVLSVWQKVFTFILSK